jgi:putative transposase
MSRIARVVVPGYPHHITQRGNRRQQTFFTDGDYRAYIRFLAKEKRRAEAEIWGYCLMPNHTHVVVVPKRPDSLAALFKEAHRKYTRRINSRMRWSGHLWQERFHSFPMDELHTFNAVRYAELNPVRARICQTAEEWPWSSVHAHMRKEDDLLVRVEPMLERVDDWKAYLGEGIPESVLKLIRHHGRTGRPVGSEDFIRTLERKTGRSLRKRKPGPPPVDK